MASHCNSNMANTLFWFFRPCEFTWESDILEYEGKGNGEDKEVEDDDEDEDDEEEVDDDDDDEEEEEEEEEEEGETLSRAEKKGMIMRQM